jgi:hypothetical protein
MEEMRNVHKFLARMSEGKRPLRRPRHWWGHYIKIVLRKSDLELWISFNWLRIGTGGKLL